MIKMVSKKYNFFFKDVMRCNDFKNVSKKKFQKTL